MVGFPRGERDHSRHQPYRPWGPHTSRSVGTVVSFPSERKRPEHEAGHTPPSSAKLRGAVPLFRHMPSWRARGHPYLYLAILSVGHFNCVHGVPSAPDEDNRFTEISVLFVHFSPF